MAWQSVLRTGLAEGVALTTPLRGMPPMVVPPVPQPPVPVPKPVVPPLGGGGPTAGGGGGGGPQRVPGLSAGETRKPAAPPEVFRFTVPVSTRGPEMEPPPPLKPAEATVGDVAASFGESIADLLRTNDLASFAPSLLEAPAGLVRAVLKEGEKLPGVGPIASVGLGLSETAFDLFFQAYTGIAEKTAPIAAAIKTEARDGSLALRAQGYSGLITGTPTNELHPYIEQKIMLEQLLGADEATARQIVAAAVDLPLSVKGEIEANPGITSDPAKLDDLIASAPEGLHWTYDSGPMAGVANLIPDLTIDIALLMLTRGAFAIPRAVGTATQGAALVQELGLIGRSIPFAQTAVRAARAIPGLPTTARVATAVTSRALRLQNRAAAAGLGVMTVTMLANGVARYMGNQKMLDFTNEVFNYAPFSENPNVQWLTGFSINPPLGLHYLKRGIVKMWDGSSVAVGVATGNRIAKVYSSPEKLEEIVSYIYGVPRASVPGIIERHFGGNRGALYDEVVNYALQDVLNRQPAPVRAMYQSVYQDIERTRAVLRQFAPQVLDVLENHLERIKLAIQDNWYAYRGFLDPFDPEKALLVNADYRATKILTYEVRTNNNAVLGYPAFLVPEATAQLRRTVGEVQGDMIPAALLDDFNIQYGGFHDYTSMLRPFLKPGGGGKNLVPRDKIMELIEIAERDYRKAADVNPVAVRTGSSPVLRADSPIDEWAEAFGTDINTIAVARKATADLVADEPLLRAFLQLKRDYLSGGPISEADIALMPAEEVVRRARDYVEETAAPWVKMGEDVAVAEAEVRRLTDQAAAARASHNSVAAEQYLKEAADLSETIRTARGPLRPFSATVRGAETTSPITSYATMAAARRKVDAISRLTDMAEIKAGLRDVFDDVEEALSYVYKRGDGVLIFDSSSPLMPSLVRKLEKYLANTPDSGIDIASASRTQLWKLVRKYVDEAVDSKGKHLTLNKDERGAFDNARAGSDDVSTRMFADATATPDEALAALVEARQAIDGARGARSEARLRADADNAAIPHPYEAAAVNEFAFIHNYVAEVDTLPARVAQVKAALADPLNLATYSEAERIISESYILANKLIHLAEGQNFVDWLRDPANANKILAALPEGGVARTPTDELLIKAAATPGPEGKRLMNEATAALKRDIEAQGFVRSTIKPKPPLKGVTPEQAQDIADGIAPAAAGADGGLASNPAYVAVKNLVADVERRIDELRIREAVGEPSFLSDAIKGEMLAAGVLPTAVNAVATVIELRAARLGMTADELWGRTRLISAEFDPAAHAGALLQDTAPAPARRAMLEEAPPQWLVDADPAMARAEPLVQYNVGDQEFFVPGGLEGEWSVWDANRFRVQKIDARRLYEADPQFAEQLYAKMFRSMRRDLSDPIETFNLISFAQMSPQTDFILNEARAVAVRLRSPKAIRAFAKKYSSMPAFDRVAANGKRQVGDAWTAGERATPAQVQELGRIVAADYGLTGELKGLDEHFGNMVLAAQTFRRYPELFTLQPGQDLNQFAERLMNVTRGAGLKVGTFGPMLADPVMGTRGTIDVHMVRFINNFIEQNRELLAAREIEQGLRAGYLTRPLPLDPKGAPIIPSAREVAFRVRGEINPAVPPHLHDMEPYLSNNKISIFEGSEYERANAILAVDQELAGTAKSFGLGGHQWFRWDQQRNGRIEPHVLVYPRSYGVKPGPLTGMGEGGRQSIMGAVQELRRGGMGATGAVEGYMMSPKLALYLQAGGATPRGFTVRSINDTLIAVTRAADATTAHHEIWHGILEPSLTSAELDILTRHNAIGEAGAQMWEKFVTVGRTGIRELDAVFAKLKVLFERVYAAIRGTPLENELHPEVRATFESLFARPEGLRRPGEPFSVESNALRAEWKAAKQEMTRMEREAATNATKREYRKLHRGASVELEEKLYRYSADMTALPDRALLDADPLGAEVLSIMGWGFPGKLPSTLQDVVTVLREIEKGNGEVLGLGPEVLARAQRLGEALLNRAVNRASEHFAGVGVFRTGQHPTQWSKDDLDTARRLQRDGLVEYNESGLGLKYGFKKPPKDSVVLEFEELRRVEDEMGIPHLAEELFRGHFESFQTRLGAAQARAAFNFIFGPESLLYRFNPRAEANDTIYHRTLAEFRKRAARYGVPVEDADRVWRSYSDYAATTHFPKIINRMGRYRLERGEQLIATPQNIPNGKLTELGQQATTSHYGTALPDWWDKVPWHDVFRESQSIVMRKLADFPARPIGKTLEAMYGLVTNNKMVRTLYYIYRFGADMRYHAMNFFEGAMLYAGRAVLRPGEFDRGLMGMTHDRMLRIGQDPYSDVGYEFSRSRGRWAHKAYTKEEPDAIRGEIARIKAKDPKALERAFEEMAANDPELSKTIAAMGDNPHSWMITMDKWYERILNATDPKGVIDEEIGVLMAAEPAMQEIYGRIQAVQHQLWDDVRSTFFGNPNRSQLERTLNSWLLYWPLSYTVKTTKWLLRTMFDRLGGLPTNAYGAYAIDKLSAEHNRLMAEDPEYAEWVKDNQTLIFTAQMIFPMTPWSVGVSLNPLMRNIFFPETSKKVLEYGPTYTVSTYLPQVMGDLYPHLGDVPDFADLLYRSIVGRQAPGFGGDTFPSPGGGGTPNPFGP